MGRQENYETPEENDEEMTVTLDLDDGTSVTCAIVTILTVNNRDYIVLLPLEEDGENHDGEVWFYRYSEDENDPNAEPVLDYIDSDEEYDQVAEAFDEYLDNAEFDEIMDDSTEDLYHTGSGSVSGSVLLYNTETVVLWLLLWQHTGAFFLLQALFLPLPSCQE